MATQVYGTIVPTHSIPQLGYQRIRAVVADDIREVREATIGLLQRHGCIDVVGTADDGIMAVELTEALLPDLVVLDVSMPRMSGLEATVQIKQLAPRAKVLVISADDDPEVARCALASGADAFVWKGNLAQECDSQIERMFTI